MSIHYDQYHAEMADRRERLLTQLAPGRTRRRLSIRRLVAERSDARTAQLGRTLAPEDLERRA
ncbi:hypothetical protein [Ruania halotolerans]|uniref:hypothetical protein n=1 Tax=Ruania halotolerans TaxID=2897773 RepID=UPI001E5006B5|nr:hypothetical protein [Ruania halotolerans]UFU07066.1 hypothetical protein LQF10_02835 [Ruania halotolerans]